MSLILNQSFVVIIINVNVILRIRDQTMLLYGDASLPENFQKTHDQPKI